MGEKEGWGGTRSSTSVCACSTFSIFKSDDGELWSLVTHGPSVGIVIALWEQRWVPTLSLQIEANEENLEDTQGKFLVSTSSLTKLNRDESLIYFYLEWKNTNLIFWPSRLEIAAEPARGVSGRTILCPLQNRKECSMALNNHTIWKNHLWMRERLMFLSCSDLQVSCIYVCSSSFVY